MSGWYTMHRGWQESAVFGNAEYSERDAWAWMIENAVYEDTTANIKGKPIKLKRGQLSYSIRYLADAWKWHKAKVERFVSKLEKWSMIETDTETGQQVITICNYSQYQSKTKEVETETETGARQERDRSETNNNKDKQLNNKTTPPLPPKPEGQEKSFFDQFFEIYPNPTGIGAARQSWQTQTMFKGADPEKIVAAAKAFARKHAKTEKKFIPKPEKFLNDQTYLDPDLNGQIKIPVKTEEVEVPEGYRGGLPTIRHSGKLWIRRPVDAQVR